MNSEAAATSGISSGKATSARRVAVMGVLSRRPRAKSSARLTLGMMVPAA